jgi:phytoene dehydrogenase-like protein
VLDAVVVGAGPNGLTAAAVLARAGLSVQVVERNDHIGGASSTEVVGGHRFDRGSAVHPLGIASPAFRALGVTDRIDWLHADIAYAHPLDDGRAASVHRDLATTASGLGSTDGPAYERLMAPLSEHGDDILDGALRPLVSVPRHPFVMARFGAQAVLSAKRLAVWQFADDASRALFAGVAAHSGRRLDAPLTAGPALVLGLAAHLRGWPIPRGGSQAIADALASIATTHGASIETTTDVRDLADLPPSRVTLLDVTPRQFLRLADRWLPERGDRPYRRWRHGVGVCKVDYVLSSPVPWANADVARAGTVHLGGTLEEIAEAERRTARGRIPPRPYVLCAQPSIVDETRAPGGQHILWTYCHVPHGYPGDMSDAVDAQVERFAPGFRDTIVERRVHTAPQLEAWNPNLVGGDLTGGLPDVRQTLARPRLTNPYATPIPGVYLCSSSTAPGAGVHGMCGWHAAHAALKSLGVRPR